MYKEDNLSKINLLNKLFTKEIYHVFFLVNPIVEIIIFLFIKLLNIPEDKVIIFRLRENPSIILDLPTYFIKKTILDRIFIKLGIDRYSNKFDRFINDKEIKYYLYSSWVHPEFKKLLQNSNCIGHFYLEEGQISHRERKFIDEQITNNETINKTSKYAEDLNAYHRSDCIYFIAIDPKAFPHINKDKKILLKDLDLIKSIYKPKLLGKKFIGIVPAPRRLYKQKLFKCLFEIASIMPNNSIIKLHPGYKLNQKRLEFFQNKIKNKINKDIEFCDQKVILEIEMLFEKKTLFGSKSSLIRYAELFKSEYKLIDLY